MLQLFKKPEDYIGYGVWVIPNGKIYPEKKKIAEVKAHFSRNRIPNYYVESIRFENSMDWYSPNHLFMKKKDCLINRREFLERRLKTQEINLDTYQRSVEIVTEDIEKIKRELEKLK